MGSDRVNIVAIDPGLTGAIAVFDMASARASTVIYKMPSDRKVRKGTRILDVHALRELLGIVKPGSHVVLEHAHARPTDGGAQAFAFGRCYGAIEAAVKFSGLPYSYESPAKWKPAMLTAEERELGKAGAVAALRRRYPRQFDDGSLKVTHDQADAILIALFHVEHRMKLPAPTELCVSK